jgi:hypothetical protein
MLHKPDKFYNMVVTLLNSHGHHNYENTVKIIEPSDSFSLKEMFNVFPLRNHL